MDYTLIASTDVGALERAVKLMIPDGWRPNGPPVPLTNGQMCQSLVKGGSNGGAGEVSSEDITDATEVGRTVLTAADDVAVRAAIGAGTSDLELGSGASQAMPGNTTIPDAVTWESLDKPVVIAAGADSAAARSAIGAAAAEDIPDVPDAPTWETLDKPAVIAAGADSEAARAAIGAGTGDSNLELGTSGSQAAAGNHNHDGTYADAQALSDLADRVAALEAADG